MTTYLRIELIEKLRTSLVDEQLHKFAYVETVDTEFLIQAEVHRGILVLLPSQMLPLLSLYCTSFVTDRWYGMVWYDLICLCMHLFVCLFAMTPSLKKEVVCM